MSLLQLHIYVMPQWYRYYTHTVYSFRDISLFFANRADAISRYLMKYKKTIFHNYYVIFIKLGRFPYWKPRQH